MNIFVPGLGGVEQLIGKGVRELGQTCLDLAVAALLLGGKRNAGKTEVTQGVIDTATLGFVELGPGWSLLERLPGAEHAFMLAQPGAVGRELAQARLIGFTQCR